MQAMILAAWEGTRLRPQTLSMPKTMLPVGDKPTLEWILKWLRAYGISDIGINLRHHHATVQNYFGTGADCGVRLTYSIEDTLLGTAGGVKRLAHLFNETIVLVYGDVLTDLNLEELIRFHHSRSSRPHVTLSLMPVSNPMEYGIAEVMPDGRVTRFMEKPAPDCVFSNIANAGILVLDREILESVPENSYFDFSYDLFPRLLTTQTPIYGWMLPQDSYLIDMGSPEKYLRVQCDWPTRTLEKLLSPPAQPPVSRGLSPTPVLSGRKEELYPLRLERATTHMRCGFHRGSPPRKD